MSRSSLTTVAPVKVIPLLLVCAAFVLPASLHAAEYLGPIDVLASPDGKSLTCTLYNSRGVEQYSCVFNP